tara:strand:- start:2349 stop:2504 length:156 start_codon:yes stop_codon:yes gene_type:complete
MSEETKKIPSDEEEVDIGIEEDDILLTPATKKPRSFRARICEKLSRLFVKR